VLTNTFCHIPLIGLRLEQRLWEAGVQSWDDLSGLAKASVSPARAAAIERDIEESRRQLAAGNPYYFAEYLPSNQHWRLFPEFRHKTAYLDIETTGIDGYDAHITSISVYDGTVIRCYVYEENLDDFKDDINEYDVLVTFNGKTFDLPFIESYFMKSFNKVHIDLRFVLKSLGYGGGLKLVEKQLGISRGALDGVDGYFAVLLWYEYCNNDNRSALETMLAYNIADTVNLEKLMVLAYNRKLEGTPFVYDHELCIPQEPASPFAPDPQVIEYIKEKYRCY
jgi:uncharacterized protein YprB with RNaseH-like and TPR domain